MKSASMLALALYLAAGPAAAQGPSGGQDTVYQPGPDVTPPKVVSEVKPAYTAEARRAGIQGVVGLECVVEKDGHPGEIRVTKALDPGLDEEAVKALRRWRFEPGKKDGKPVRVRIDIEMTFTLR
jgi:TonB family protein